ncbi:hypothetical protein ABPG77_005118 [Micractinium sp. CCAP 211/92]
MAPSTVSEPSPGPLELPPSTKVPLERANPLLSCTIGKWLKAHGKTVKPKLSESQKADARMCFKLMDADGSGAIDAEELGAAFRLLGINMSQREVEGMLAEVDRDGSGEVEYPEFLEIMTIQLTKMAQQKVDASAPPARAAAAAAGDGTTQADGSGQGAGLNMASVLPFDVVATAYRRKKLMGALEDDDKEFILSVAAAEEEERQRAEAEAAAAAAAALRRPSRRVSAALLQSLGRSRQAAGGGKRCAGATSREGCHGGGAALPGPASHASFLNSLTKEERRIIDALSRKYRGDTEAEPQLAAAQLRQQRQQLGQQQGCAAATASLLAGKTAAGAAGAGLHLAALQHAAVAAAAASQQRPGSAAQAQAEGRDVQGQLGKTVPAPAGATKHRPPSAGASRRHRLDEAEAAPPSAGFASAATW